MITDLNSYSESFWSKVDRSAGADGCWTWQACLNETGYGKFGTYINGRQKGWRAHRLAYVFLVGPIPEDLVLDHLCRNTVCVNPAHLEPVTGGENVRRGMAPNLIAHRENRCTHGHEFTPDNTYLRPDGAGRQCRACRERRGRERRRKAA